LIASRRRAGGASSSCCAEALGLDVPAALASPDEALE
jgi:hypothetical protein